MCRGVSEAPLTYCDGPQPYEQQRDDEERDGDGGGCELRIAKVGNEEEADAPGGVQEMHEEVSTGSQEGDAMTA